MQRGNTASIEQLDAQKVGHASEARSSPLDQEGSDFLTKLRRDAQRRLQVIYHRLPFFGCCQTFVSTSSVQSHSRPFRRNRTTA